MLINGVSLKFRQFILNGELWYVLIEKKTYIFLFYALARYLFLRKGRLDIFSAPTMLWFLFLHSFEGDCHEGIEMDVV